MRRILLVLLMMLSGIVMAKEPDAKMTEAEKLIVPTVTQLSVDVKTGPPYQSHIVIIEIEKHSYILVVNQAGTAIVHAESCICRKPI